MLRAFAQQTHVRACPCVPAGVSIARISRGLRVHSGEGGLPAFGDVSLVAAVPLASAGTSETVIETACTQHTAVPLATADSV